jgi:phosphoadenosine phosphosulfate reductase
MEKKGFPTRRNRWCCDEYKESRSPKDATLIMGIRAEESASRRRRWLEVQRHWRTGSKVVSPILGMASDEIWAFILDNGLPYCSLYNEGFHRLGCIGCPLAREASRRKEFERWPAFEQKWRRSFRRIWERRSGTLQRDGREWFGDAFFRDWEEMWDWWLSDKGLPTTLTKSPRTATRRARRLWDRVEVGEW